MCRGSIAFESFSFKKYIQWYTLHYVSKVTAFNVFQILIVICPLKRSWAFYAPVTLSRTGSAYIVVYQILYPVAKSHDGQIWETDCTHERTCNERTWAGCHEQGTNINRSINRVTEWVMKTNRTLNGWSARITNVYRIQRTSNERITNKLRTFTGQYEHTSDNYRTCVSGTLDFTLFQVEF